jgi:hypothetical protein
MPPINPVQPSGAGNVPMPAGVNGPWSENASVLSSPGRQPGEVQVLILGDQGGIWNEMLWALVGGEMIGGAGRWLFGRWLGAAVDGTIERGASTAAKGARNPVVREAAEYGKQIHKTYDYGPGFEREFRLPSGRRADAVNLETEEVLELKPNNPRAVQRGAKQLDAYIKELEENYGGEWTGRVITYDR